MGSDGGKAAVEVSRELGERIHAMFGVRAGDAERARRVLASAGRRKGPAVLSVARANNLAIMAKALEGLGGADEIRGMVLRGNSNLRPDHLELLTQMVPSSTEVRLLGEVDASLLADAERMLLALSKVPRLRTKLDVLLFSREFWDVANDAEKVRASTKTLAYRTSLLSPCRACLPHVPFSSLLLPCLPRPSIPSHPIACHPIPGRSAHL